MEQNKEYGICPLCNKCKKLIRSHIIPEGFFKPMYNEKGQVVFASNSRGKTRYLQNGRKEYLLCKDCDGGLGIYDKYGKEVICDRILQNEIQISNGLLWSELDYNKFKLFHLSILLRAHFSKDVTCGIKLNSKQVDEIKSYILNGKAPSKYKYPIFAYRLENNGKYFYNDFVTFGNTFKNEDDIIMAVFIFGGFVWTYILDDINPNSLYEEGLSTLFLDENGTIKIMDRDINNFLPLWVHKESIEDGIEYVKRKSR